MSLNLMYITNRPEIAAIAQKYGVDRIFVDLESVNKNIRQKGLDSVQSHHTLQDVAHIREAVRRSELLVRVNSIYEGSKKEIDAVVASGADIVMLPYFKRKEEVERFLDYTNGRCKTMLLVETSDAAEQISQFLNTGIDFIHIGLNDLHLCYRMDFMFQLLSDGTVERLCKAIAKRKIPYGFGGIAAIGAGALPSENIIAEHYRLGSTCAILSRSFCDSEKLSIDETREKFEKGIAEIRNYEKFLTGQSGDFFDKNKAVTYAKIDAIVAKLRNGKRWN